MESIKIVYAGSPGPGHGPWRPIPDTPEARKKALADCQAFTTMSFEFEPERGKPEPIRYGDLWLDFDCKECPALAVIAARFFIRNVVNDYDIDPNMLRIFMSGSKGLHLCIPAELFGGENGHPALPILHRRMVEKLLGDKRPCNSPGMLSLGSLNISDQLKQQHIHSLVDFSLYSTGKGHLLRVKNVCRPDGRYKVPVSFQEFNELRVDELLKLTRKPREIPEPVGQPTRTRMSELYDRVLLLWQGTANPTGSQDSLKLCQFMRYCRENAATLTEPEWFMMLCICAKLGERGFALAHEYSKEYPSYSKQKMQDKLHHILRNNYSVSCDAIQNVFTCIERCKVRSPLELKGKQKSQQVATAKSFCLRADGVYYSPSQALEDDAVFLCTPLRILGKSCLPDGSGWSRLVEITAPNNAVYKVHLPMKEFSGRGDTIRALLLDHGLEIASIAKANILLMDYIRLGAPEGVFLTCVEQLGWHGGTYVLPDEQFGTTADATLYFESRSENLFVTSGTLEDWQEHVGRYAQGNPLLVFLLSFAVSSVLLRLCNIEGCGIHICGGSSSGKTTAAIVAGSVCGGGGNVGFVRQWRSTDNALESIAASHNDNLLVLDELGQASSDVVSNVIYMLTNGQGKGRLRADASLRKIPKWKINFLSTGEVSSSEKIEESGRHRAMAGQDVRVINLPVSSSGEFSVFRNLHGLDSAAALSDYLKQAAQKFYGSPLRAFLRNLCGGLIEERNRNVRHIAEAMGSFTNAHCPANASGQVKRVAGKFGLIAAAGAFAADSGVFPFITKEEILHAAQLCFQHWLKQRAGTGDLELGKALEKIKDFFNMYSKTRFSAVDALCHANFHLAGFRWEKDGEKHYLMLAPVFSELTRGCNREQLLAELKRLGWLVTNANGNLQETKSVNGENKRGYVFRPYVWTGPCEPMQTSASEHAAGDDDPLCF